MPAKPGYSYVAINPSDVYNWVTKDVSNRRIALGAVTDVVVLMPATLP